MLSFAGRVNLVSACLKRMNSCLHVTILVLLVLFCLVCLVLLLASLPPPRLSSCLASSKGNDAETSWKFPFPSLPPSPPPLPRPPPSLAECSPRIIKDATTSDISGDCLLPSVDGGVWRERAIEGGPRGARCRTG